MFDPVYHVVEQVLAVDLLQQQEVTDGLELELIAPHQVHVDLALVPALGQLVELGPRLARRVVQIAVVGRAESAALEQRWVVSLRHQLAARMAPYMCLRRRTSEPVSCHHAFSAFVPLIFVRSAQI